MSPWSLEGAREDALDRRDRVLTALRGERPDRVPVSFWWHDYARENSATDLASATVSNALRYDFDYIKVQSRFTVFAESWGGRWRPSGQLVVAPAQLEPAIRHPSELDAIAARTPDLAPLDEQLEALRLIKRMLPDDRPVIMTVFSPLMALQFFFPDTPDPRAAMLAALRADEARADRVLDAIGVVLARFAGDCITQGADGVFLASNLATSDLTTVDDLRNFERPYDLKILSAVEAAPFNMVHLCGYRTHFDEYADYPASCFSWAVGGGNPGPRDGQLRSGRAVVGGISAKPELGTMTPAAVALEAIAVLRETDGAGLLLAAGCSIDASTPPANLRAAIAEARDRSL